MSGSDLSALEWPSSRDLLVWQRPGTLGAGPLINNPGSNGLFDGVAWRDPCVIQVDDRYFCFLTARVVPGNSYLPEVRWDSGGCIVLLQSENMYDWTQAAPKIITSVDQFYEMEMPQVFWRSVKGGKRYYLLFSTWDKSCSNKRRQTVPPEQCLTGTYYLTSDIVEQNNTDCPVFTESARLLAANLYGGKVVFRSGSSPVFFGFVMHDSAGKFRGGLSDPLDVKFPEDGRILLI